MSLFAIAYIGTSHDSINFMFLLGGCIGSYLADADYKYSLAGKILPLWIWFKHREETHSIYFAIVCSCLFGVYNKALGLGILIGMILHLMADKTTTMGQIDGLRYLLYPWKNHYRETLYRTKNTKRYALKK